MEDYLLDTNILLRLSDPGSPDFQTALNATANLATRHRLFVTAQNLIEFWAVATRPLDVNGLGWNAQQTAEEVEKILDRFRFLEDTSTVFEQWFQLVQAHGIQGKQVHDARLVALMLVHGVHRLLTFEEQDFKRYTEITAIHPRDATA